jgi:hypothetical protein
MKKPYSFYRLPLLIKHVALFLVGITSLLTMTACSEPICNCGTPPLPVQFTFRSKTEASTIVQAIRQGDIQITYSTPMGTQRVAFTSSVVNNTTMFETRAFDSAVKADGVRFFTVSIGSVYVGIIRAEGGTGFVDATIYFNDMVVTKTQGGVLDFILP